MFPLLVSSNWVVSGGGEMAGSRYEEHERRSGTDRRKFPRFNSIYKWNFDPSGNWWEERRSGEDRRQDYVTTQGGF